MDVGPRQDEVGELAEAFNAMADSLAKSEKRRSEFIANVSHELKTPMTTIAGAQYLFDAAGTLQVNTYFPTDNGTIVTDETGKVIFFG